MHMRAGGGDDGSGTKKRVHKQYALAWTAGSRVKPHIVRFRASPGGARCAGAAPTVCTETVLQPPSVAALRPSDVRLGISEPRAGETMLEVDSSESITVSVDYWGPRLVPADGAHAVDDLHLVYILDTDASPYIGTTQPMLVCDKHVAHSTRTHVTFDNVAHGSHTLAVLLAGSNNISVNPPVAASVTFTVK